MAVISIWLLVGASALVLHYVRRWFVRRAFARQYGCQPPPTRPARNPILEYFHKSQKPPSLELFNALPLGVALHQEYGPTYRELTWYGTTIKTSSAANIQVVYGTKSKDYGIQPFRLAGMRPFCGEGLLTTDGAIWERSRAMIKPSFHKNNISDLGAFKKSVEHLIHRIPKDGSMVDLQPLATLMVCTASYVYRHEFIRLCLQFADTSTQFLLGHPLGMLNVNASSNDPVDGKSFLRAWQLSLRSCSIRNSLGILRFMMSKSETVHQWQIVHRLIEFHIDRALGNIDFNDENNHRSLLENLLEQTRDKVEIRNQIIQGMMAAQDTTSVLISNAIFLLSRNPNVWERLRAEVASVNSALMTAEDTTKFRFIHHILHECKSHQ